MHWLEPLNATVLSRQKLRKKASSEIISIDTGQHPRIVEVEGEKGSNLANVWEKIRSLFQ